ncbi:hypothetical protein D3C81_2277470 [compost metagenome]
MLKGVFVGFVVMIAFTPVFNWINVEFGPLLSMAAGYLVIALLMIWNASKEKTLESTAG